MDFKVMQVGQFVDIGNDLKIHYHERGGGQPVVFLHGGGQGASGISNWKHNLDYFAQHGYRALAPDALGYGLSSKPEEATFDLTLLNDGLRRFLDALGIHRASLVGNSMGGAMAIKFAQDFPQRVEKLIVMGPGGDRRYQSLRCYAGHPDAVPSGPGPAGADQGEVAADVQNDRLR